MAVFVVNNKKVNAEEFWDNVEVVFNADANGKPGHVFEIEEQVEEEGVTTTQTVKKQYVASRDVEVSVYFTEDITNIFNEFVVCETIPENTENNTTDIEYCSTHELRAKKVELIVEEEKVEKFVASGVFQIRGINDGVKKVTVNIRSTATGTTEKMTQNLYLDTTAPVITINEGEYVYLPAGTRFEDKGATCTDDSDIKENTCLVTKEGSSIDSNKAGYQYIVYTATDFLGNVEYVTRKIMVEASKEEGGISFYWIAAGMLLVVVGAGLTYVVIKNKEKQRNQSVL